MRVFVDVIILAKKKKERNFRYLLRLYIAIEQLFNCLMSMDQHFDNSFTYLISLNLHLSSTSLLYQYKKEAFQVRSSQVQA